MKIFTQTETSFIMDNFRLLSNRELGERLGRSIPSIKNFLNRAGLKRGVYDTSPISDEISSFILDNYRDMPYRLLAEHTGLTSNAVLKFLRRRGLYKPRGNFSDRYTRPESGISKSRIVKRDGGCVVCGEGKYLDVHHIDESRDNNDPANLVLVCPNHHRAIHLGDISITQWERGHGRNSSPYIYGTYQSNKITPNEVTND